MHVSRSSCTAAVTIRCGWLSLFVRFVILSNSEVYFVPLNFLPLSSSSPSPPDCLNCHFFHLVLSLVSSSPVAEEMVHGWCLLQVSHLKDWSSQQASCIATYWRRRNFPKLETQGFIHLPWHVFSVPFEQSYDMLPGIQLLSKSPGSPIHSVPCLPAPFQSLKQVRMIHMVLRTKVCPPESRPQYNV